jgi:hypothetical protein
MELVLLRDDGTESLAAASEAVSVVEHFLHVRRDLVELRERDDDLTGLPVLDVEHDEITCTLEALEFIRLGVELNGLLELGVTANDDRDEILVAALGAGEIRYANGLESQLPILLLVVDERLRTQSPALFMHNASPAKSVEITTVSEMPSS